MLLRAHEQALNISLDLVNLLRTMTPTSVCEEDDGDVGDDGKHTSKRTSEYHVVHSLLQASATMRRARAKMRACASELTPLPCSLPQYMCANAPDKADARSPMVVARESLRAIVRTRSA